MQQQQQGRSAERVTQNALSGEKERGQRLTAAIVTRLVGGVVVLGLYVAALACPVGRTSMFDFPAIGEPSDRIVYGWQTLLGTWLIPGVAAWTANLVLLIGFVLMLKGKCVASVCCGGLIFGVGVATRGCGLNPLVGYYLWIGSALAISVFALASKITGRTGDKEESRSAV